MIPTETTKEPHALIHAGKWLLADLFSTLIFVGLYAVTHSIYLATGLGIGLGLGQIVYLKVKASRIDLMQWMSLGLVVVFGGATLVTHNPVFVMLKPTLIYAAIGMVMLNPGWMNRYVPLIVRERAGDITKMFGFIWAGLMFVTGAANLAAALLLGPVAWAWFVGVFPIASKLILVMVQYLATRRIVRRRIRVAVPS